MRLKARHSPELLLRRYPTGLTSQEMLRLLRVHYRDDVSLATLRKLVQNGLVGRSRREGMGKLHGSRGHYPVTAFIQLVAARSLAKSEGRMTTKESEKLVLSARAMELEQGVMRTLEQAEAMVGDGDIPHAALDTLVELHRGLSRKLARLMSRLGQAA